MNGTFETVSSTTLTHSSPVYTIFSERGLGSKNFHKVVIMYTENLTYVSDEGVSMNANASRTAIVTRKALKRVTETR